MPALDPSSWQIATEPWLDCFPSGERGNMKYYPFDQNRSKGGLKGAKKGQIPVDLTDAQGGHSSAPLHSRSPADTDSTSLRPFACLLRRILSPASRGTATVSRYGCAPFPLPVIFICSSEPVQPNKHNRVRRACRAQADRAYQFGHPRY